jgi:hypothetical protein
VTASADAIIEKVRGAFRRVPYPGDAFLQGSFDGCEPYDEIQHFKGKTEWAGLEPAFLDQRYCAPGFFSEAAFRFFIPAWIVADLRDSLQTADPCFQLTNGFADQRYTPADAAGGPPWEWGGSVLINPRRYGAIRWMDYSRHRLSVFAREEAAAIADYLRFRRERSRGENDEEVRVIGEALDLFWLERARSAPTQDDLEARVQRELARHEAHLRRREAGG